MGDPILSAGLLPDTRKVPDNLFRGARPRDRGRPEMPGGAGEPWAKTTPTKSVMSKRDPFY